MTGAKYVAPFLGREPGRALFVGFYKIGASRALTFEQYWRVPAYAEMKEFGMHGFRQESGRESVLWFDLSLTVFMRAGKAGYSLAGSRPSGHGGPGRTGRDSLG